MTNSISIAEMPPKLPRAAEGTENIWHEFWAPRTPQMNTPGIRASVVLNRPGCDQRQFVVETGSGHHFLVDDATGGTGPKPIELVAAALAGCTAFDVITVLRKKRRQDVTGYEVRVVAEQAERPPQAFVAVRIHHIVTGHGVDPAAVHEAIQISEEKYCAVEAMLRHTATVTTTFEILEERAGSTLAPTVRSREAPQGT